MSHPGNDVLKEMLREPYERVGKELEIIIAKNLRQMCAVIESYIAMSKMLNTPSHFLEDVLKRMQDILPVAEMLIT